MNAEAMWEKVLTTKPERGQALWSISRTKYQKWCGVFFFLYESPIGKFVITSDGKNLLGIHSEHDSPLKEKHSKYTGYTLETPDVIANTITWLDEYFEGKNPSPHKLPFLLFDTEFRRKVWAILLKIPYGEIITYNDIAIELERSAGIEHLSRRAVGGAVGHNPIPIIIPCHRVISVDKKLSGFSFMDGVETKIKLLELEGHAINQETMKIIK